MMNKEIDNEYILSFRIGRLNLGIYLNIIERAIRAVQISPLPGAPTIASGIINLGGKAIPVVNFRKRFGLKNKQAEPGDKMIIVRSTTLLFGFLADDIIGLKNIKNKSFSESAGMLPGTNKLVEGVAVIDDEMILIHDVNKFLSIKEEKQLSNALEKKSKKERP